MLTRPRVFRPTFFLWLKIRIESDKKFNLSFPIPLFILSMLIDIIFDIATVWSIFYKRQTDDITEFKLSRQSFNDQWKNPSPALVLSTAKVVRGMIRTLTFRTGALDLIDIEFEDDDERIYVKCLLR